MRTKRWMSFLLCLLLGVALFPMIVLADGELICDDSAARVLSDSEIIERANLKETSLFTLAKKAGLEDPLRFIRNFITHEKGLRS